MVSRSNLSQSHEEAQSRVGGIGCSLGLVDIPFLLLAMIHAFQGASRRKMDFIGSSLAANAPQSHEGPMPVAPRRADDARVIERFSIHKQLLEGVKSH